MPLEDVNVGSIADGLHANFLRINHIGRHDLCEIVLYVIDEYRTQSGLAEILDLWAEATETASDDEYVEMVAEIAAEHRGKPIGKKTVAAVMLAAIDLKHAAEIAGAIDDGCKFRDLDAAGNCRCGCGYNSVHAYYGVDDVDQAQGEWIDVPDVTDQASIDALSLRLSEVTNDMAELKIRFGSHCALSRSDTSSLDERVSVLEDVRQRVLLLENWRNDWQTRYADVTAIRNEVSDLRDEVEYLSKEVQKGKVARWTES
jgi:GNAT superfamily N-acetyltransferase